MRAAVFLLSAAVLAHEICLLRVLAIAWYSHAAALVVAVALLGFGAAGTLLALAPRWKHPRGVAIAAALYAVFMPLSLIAARAVDFNVLQVGWDSGEWLRFLLLQAVFLVPFLCAALAIAIALALHAEKPGPIYAMNLLGSGLGAMAAAPLLTLGPPEDVLRYIAVAAAFSAVLIPGRAPRVCGAVAAVVAVLIGGVGLPMSPFKDLPATPQARVLETRHGPLGRVDLVASPALHDAPGLALMAEHLPGKQQGLFVDGQQAGVKDLEDAAYLDHTLGALPFELVTADPEVLLLGIGPDLARADQVVEANADLLALSGAEGVVAEPRAYLEGVAATHSDGAYDLIVLHVGTRDPVHEAPLLTKEGLRAALACVKAGGAVAVSTHLMTPPRPGLRLLLTAERVTRHVIAVRSMKRLCVVLRHSEPTPANKAAVEAFCQRHGFDVVRPKAWAPETPHHRSDVSFDAPGADYPYDVEPTTDARPYFHRFFRWDRLGDVFEPTARPFVQWSFVVVLVAFLQVTLLSLLLLLGPLIASRAARAPAPLFLALGLGFMLLEMAYLARATMRVASPTLAAAAVIGGFMVGSGLGSLVVERLGKPLRRAALAVAWLALPGYLLMPASPLGVGLLCAIVAFPMGIPFPSALSRLPSASVPWALAVNGCASVAAAAGAPLLSTTWGIPLVAGAAAVLYALVALGTRRVPSTSVSDPQPGAA
ncbi:MAG: hypothetical protein QNJ90_15885 [Planctomycetota bacterium]|nr:hypothetical protein [Planctomycetota bacterium]